MLIRLGLIVLSLLYPVAVYFGLQHFDPRSLVLLLVLLAGLRLLSDRESPLNGRLLLPVFAVLVLWILLSNSALGLKLYPVLMNLSLLLLFAWSLRHPPSMIERMARLRQPDLPAQARSYTRRVTQLWCGFFLVNGSIALATVWASDELWVLYNGLIAYVLMGLLLGGEWLVRQRAMRAVND